MRERKGEMYKAFSSQSGEKDRSVAGHNALTSPFIYQLANAPKSLSSLLNSFHSISDRLFFASPFCFLLSTQSIFFMYSIVHTFAMPKSPFRMHIHFMRVLHSHLSSFPFLFFFQSMCICVVSLCVCV